MVPGDSMWFHVLLDQPCNLHLYTVQNQCYKSTKLLISEMSLPGVYIKLADNLVPQSPVRESEQKQSELLEAWTRTNKVARDKISRLGSEETKVCSLQFKRPTTTTRC